jgi:hypothetical protein
VKVSPPSEAQAYSGPYRLPQVKKNQDTLTVEISNVFSLTSSSGGIIASVIGNNLASFLDTTSLQTLWDEWRVLSMLAIYYPNVQSAVGYSGTTPLTYSVCYGIVDNDNSTPLPSAAAAVDYASVTPFALNERSKLAWKMSGSEDSLFINNNGTSTSWFKYYCSGLTASTNYGQVIVKCLVQFRGRI